MLRRYTSSTRFLLASSSFHQNRLCSSTSTSSTDDRGNNTIINSNTPPDSNAQQQQQHQQIPQVLQQFDQHMRTNPEFRKLYPKLLKAIVTNSKEDIVKVAEKMSQLTTISQSEAGKRKEAGVEEPKSVEKKKEASDVQQQTLSSAEIAALGLNLVVVDVAFADMFYHGEEEEQEQEPSASSSSPNPLEEEESDEELLQLLLSHFGEDFKKQKARIGKFVLETIQRERDQLMIKEKGLQILSAAKNNKKNAANRRSSAATLPNFAVTITPPIEAENRVTAKLLLKQIKTEVSTLSDFFDGDKQKIVASVLKRRVFSGAVGPWIHHEGDGEINNNNNNEEESQIEQMTKALFQKQKKKAIGDVEFDPDVNMMACRVAVENDFVENKNRRGVEDDENTTANTSSSNLLRFDIGIEESTFASSIGLDLFFDFEKDGDKAVNEMNDAVSEICKRVSERLNSGFRVGKKSNNDNDNSSGVFGEEAILPFAFTMRCKILMKQ